jgi:hypothetical protein
MTEEQEPDARHTPKACSLLRSLNMHERADRSVLAHGVRAVGTYTIDISSIDST